VLRERTALRPNPLAGFEEPLRGGGEGTREGREGKIKERKGKGENIPNKFLQ